MNQEDTIIVHLQKKYDPVAIVLAGSRVSGTFSELSDWDLYVFTNQEFKPGFEELNGQTLDISVIPYPIDEAFIFDTRFHPEQHLKILLDNTDGWLQEAVIRTQKAYAAGPLPLSPEEISRIKKVMSRYIDKSENRKHIYGVVFFYLGIFYEMALRLWFQTKQQWPLSPHEALPHIENEDQHFYGQLNELACSKDTDRQINSARKIYDILFKK